jgi:hypothetical protein
VANNERLTCTKRVQLERPREYRSRLALGQKTADGFFRGAPLTRCKRSKRAPMTTTLTMRTSKPSAAILPLGPARVVVSLASTTRSNSSLSIQVIQTHRRASGLVHPTGDGLLRRIRSHKQAASCRRSARFPIPGLTRTRTSMRQVSVRQIVARCSCGRGYSTAWPLASGDGNQSRQRRRIASGGTVAHKKTVTPSLQMARVEGGGRWPGTEH